MAPAGREILGVPLQGAGWHGGAGSAGLLGTAEEGSYLGHRVGSSEGLCGPGIPCDGEWMGICPRTFTSFSQPRIQPPMGDGAGS